MYYFDSKNDLKFIKDFKSDVDLFYSSRNLLLELYRYGYLAPQDKDQAAEAERHNEATREKIAKKLNQAIMISHKCGVSTDAVSTPAPIVGGYPISVNIYSAILNDNSHGKKITEQFVLDTINQTIGQAEMNVQSDFLNVINPLFWVKTLLVKIIRVPFWILKVSGFNIDKIEELAFIKMLKLLGILFVILGLLYLGVTKLEIKKILLDKFFALTSSNLKN